MQPRVGAVRREQALVRPAFDDASVVQHQHLVRLADRAEAVRDDDVAAGMMGIPVAATKARAFLVSSFYAGVAGGLWVVALRHSTSLPSYQITPSRSAIDISICSCVVRFSINSQGG